MIRVLVVEDSPTIQTLLREILASDPAIQVVGMASNGEEGVRQAAALRPDLITMDVRMPVMDGLEATRRIMEQCPTPIVIVSASVNEPELGISFNAIREGALDVIEKPAGVGLREYESIRERLLTAVKLMSEIKVIRRRPRRMTMTLPNLRTARTQPPALLAICASTGGPAALNTLLKMMPRSFPLPVVVVQHMTSGFTQGLIDWLQAECQLPLVLAQANQRIQPGHIYFAPDNHHLELSHRGVLGLNQRPPVSFVRPSATVLFQSVARTYGAAAIGVILTGMGDDGAIGLKAIREKGGVTIAQDEATSVVYGMPKAAAELGAAEHILALEKIVPSLLTLV